MENAGDLVVSVCMITYNHEKFIKKSIESVLGQSVPFKYELVICDDCSTDRTSTYLIDYARRNPNTIRLYLSDSNIGMSGNFYKCLSLAKGRYVAYIEGDDFWDDIFKLKKQVELLERNNDCSLCCGAYTKHNQFLTDTLMRVNTQICKFNINDWGNGFLVMPLTLVFKRKCAEDFYKYGQSFTYLRDLHLIYYLLKSGNGIYVPDNLAVYNIHEGGVVSMVAKNKVYYGNYLCYNELYSKNRTSINLRKKILITISQYLKHSRMNITSVKLLVQSFRMKGFVLLHIRIILLFLLPSVLIRTLQIALSKKKV